MRGHIPLSCLRMTVPWLLSVLFLTVTVPAVLCAVYGTETVLQSAGFSYGADGFAAAAIPAALFAAGAVLLCFTAASAFYARAWFYYYLDKNQTRPKSLLKPSQAVRFIRCRARTAFFRLMWSVLYYFPAGVITLLIVFFVKNGVGMAVLTVICAADVLAAAAGTVFCVVTSSRYYLADYLLYLNPLMPPREAVMSSVKLTEGKLCLITAKRLSLIPWGLAELLILPLPFAAVYRRFCAAALCEMIFGEDKRKVRTPAVVFYVSGKSRFSEA